MMSLILVYIIALFVPGALLLSIYSVLRGRSLPQLSAYSYLLSVSLSYSQLIIVLFVARLYAETTSDFIVGYVSLALIELLLLAYLLFKQKLLNHIFSFKFNKSLALIPVLSLLIIFLYLLKVGPYLEIPSDAWWHLAQIQDMYQLIEANVIPTGNFSQIIRNQVGYWYYIAAMMISQSGIEYMQGIHTLSYANNMLFLAAFYCFTLIIVDKSGLGEVKKHAIAALAMLFTLLHFGVSEFSYVRYYAYAPVMINFVLYLTTFVLFFKYMQLANWINRYLIALALLLFTMLLVHVQEILLLSVVIFGLVIYQILFLKFTLASSSWSKLFHVNHNKMIWIFYITVIAYLIIHISAVFFIPRHNPLQLADAIAYERIFPFMKGWGMSLLDPRYKFYEVITSWGLVVYGLYFLRIRQFLGNPYLMIGMLVPFFTVFNPIFTDLFFRASYAEVLYRICYTIPLTLVGAYLLVGYGSELFDKQRVVYQRLISFVAVMALIVFMLPVSNSLIASPTRLVTLKTVQPQNDHRHWLALTAYLDTIQDPKIIHTDKLTGYLLNGMTIHQYKGWKFLEKGAVKLTVENFNIAGLHRLDGDFLIINQRDGAWSKAGLDSGHWPADVLKLSQYYSAEFLEHINSHKENFEKLWENDNMLVYKINI